MFKYRCLYCFRRFTSDKKLANHWGFCSDSCKHAYEKQKGPDIESLKKFLKECSK